MSNLQLMPHFVQKLPFLPSKTSKPNVAEDDAENGKGALRNFTVASEAAPPQASRVTSNITPASQESRGGSAWALALNPISDTLTSAAVGAGTGSVRRLRGPDAPQGGAFPRYPGK